MSPPIQQQRPQRRWYQFSLRALLIATALAAGLAFGWAKCIEPYRLQREAAAAITKLGGTYKSEDAVGWVRYLDKNAQDVVVVDLADCDAPSEYLPHLARLPQLKTLVLGGHSVGDEQVAGLGRVGSLKGLVLDSTKVTDGGVEGLKEKLPDLVVYKSQRRACVELKKVGFHLEDRDVLDLRDDKRRASPAHEAVPIWFRSEVGDVYFAEPPGVVAVNDPGVTEADASWVADLPDLAAIAVGKGNLDGSFLATVVASSLTRLDLRASNVTDAGLAHISRFPSLTWLNLRATSISDTGLTQVASLRRLSFLELHGTRITDAGLAHIMGLAHLQSFGAMGTAMGDKGLAIVAELPSLRDLDVRETLITDEGLVHLQRSKTLKYVSLSGTKITDRGIPHLEKLTQLILLSVDRTGVSQEGVVRLRNALPHCNVLPQSFSAEAK